MSKVLVVDQLNNEVVREFKHDSIDVLDAHYYEYQCDFGPRYMVQRVVCNEVVEEHTGLYNTAPEGI